MIISHILIVDINMITKPENIGILYPILQQTTEHIPRVLVGGLACVLKHRHNDAKSLGCYQQV